MYEDIADCVDAEDSVLMQYDVLAMLFAINTLFRPSMSGLIVRSVD